MERRTVWTGIALVAIAGLCAWWIAADRDRGIPPDSGGAGNETMRAGPSPPARHVVVLDDTTGLPVAGAVVLVGHEFGETDSRESYMAQHGRAFGTDADGRVAIDGYERLLFAKHGQRTAAARIPPAPNSVHRPFEVRLRPERSLTVRTIDDRGAPVAGVPVAAAWFDPQRPEWERKRLEPRGTTDTRGVLVWRDSGLQRAELGHENPTLRVDAILTGRVLRRRFDAPGPNDDEVEVRVPATGTLLVRVETPDGTTLASGHEVGLLRVLAADDPLRRSGHGIIETPPYEDAGLAEIVQGVARFDLVPLGETFVSSIGTLGSARGPGPTAMEPTAELTLRLSALPDRLPDRR